MERSPVSRRRALAGMAVALGGAGYVGASGVSGGSETVSMLAAGSLNNALENGLRPSVDARLEVEAHGSAQVARLVAEGAKTPDIVSLADVALFDAWVKPAWYAEFATNAVVVAYNPETEGGRRLSAVGADEWYRPLLDGSVALGRTDPDLDPLGYRTLFMLELATAYYDLDVDLRETIPRREQVYPETQLISGFETGAIDAAVAYRNMAVERGYDYVELPAEIDQSDPRLADHYSRARYELPDGTVVTGRPISYGSTMLRESPVVRDVFEAHVSGPYLESFGFGVPADYPRYTPHAPDTLAN
ncbi:extracellular solute-binding protein [Salinigranum sp.]|uniref:extracellular solute-binding protein n=1 Tax=Salinigranum sp. TaxID=1966351 RepID=UPI00356AE25A